VNLASDPSHLYTLHRTYTGPGCAHCGRALQQVGHMRSSQWVLVPDTLATFGPEGYDDSVAVDPPLKSVMDGDDIVISPNWDVA